MDNKHTVDMHKQLDNQSEVLMDAYRSMSHELHRLQVEEEMLMRKFYELMSVQGLTKKDKNGEDACNDGNGQSGAMVPHDPSNIKFQKECCCHFQFQKSFYKKWSSVHFQLSGLTKSVEMVKAKLCSMEVDHDNIEESCAAVITMLKARVNSRVFMEVVLKNDKLRMTSCLKCRELCFVEMERGDGSGNHEHLETDWPPPGYEHVERSARGKNVLVAPALEADAPPPCFEHPVKSIISRRNVSAAQPPQAAPQQRQQLKEVVQALVAAGVSLPKLKK
ncbi:hypothetical protein IFM89_015824 [Coptis chinensis]|uniref:Uncharacterized protein n=1 Tax=Coptis chinensis TaxID=261450 RepID=A0A835IRJ8_9MAGN|nr:hypothetical protein IFM89_015824 [Coptis chinensis]